MKLKLSTMLLFIILIFNVIFIAFIPFYSNPVYVGKKLTYDFTLTMRLKEPMGNVSAEAIRLNYSIILTVIAEYNGKYFLVDIIDKNDTSRYLKINIYQGKDGLISGFHVIESRRLKWPAETLWHLMFMLSLFKFTKGIRVNIFDVFYNRINVTHGQLWNITLTGSFIDVTESTTKGQWGRITYSIENLLVEVSITKMINHKVASSSPYKYSSLCDGNVTVIYIVNDIVPYNATSTFDMALFIGSYAPSFHVLTEANMVMVRSERLTFPLALHPNISFKRW